MSFELAVTEILKIKLKYRKIQIAMKTKVKAILQNFRLTLALMA